MHGLVAGTLLLLATCAAGGGTAMAQADIQPVRPVAECAAEQERHGEAGRSLALIFLLMLGATAAAAFLRYVTDGNDPIGGR